MRLETLAQQNGQQNEVEQLALLTTVSEHTFPAPLVLTLVLNEAQPSWVQVYRIGAFEHPTVWCLLKCHTGKGTFAEALFMIQGILKATDLLPLRQMPK